jgi:tRNA G10  N-methylase Trm11
VRFTIAVVFVVVNVGGSDAAATDVPSGRRSLAAAGGVAALVAIALEALVD